MKSQETAIYRGIQRETENAMRAIDAVSDMVYDEELSVQMSRQSLKYAQLHNEAVQALLDAKAEPYRANQLTDLWQRAEIRCNTLLNTSTGHIAELMIRNENNSMLEMEKVLRHNAEAGEQPRTLARQLMELEQKHVSRLKDYL